MKSQAPARYIFLLMKLPDGSSFSGILQRKNLPAVQANAAFLTFEEGAGTKYLCTQRSRKLTAHEEFGGRAIDEQLELAGLSTFEGTAAQAASFSVAGSAAIHLHEILIQYDTQRHAVRILNLDFHALIGNVHTAAQAEDACVLKFFEPAFLVWLDWLKRHGVVKLRHRMLIELTIAQVQFAGKVIICTQRFDQDGWSSCSALPNQAIITVSSWGAS